MYEAIEERTTVVTEGRAGVGVDLKLMFSPRVLEREREKEILHIKKEDSFFL